MITEPQTFFSSTVARTSEDAVLIALFNDGRECVGIFSGSTDAALSLVANIAASLVNGDGAGKTDA